VPKLPQPPAAARLAEIGAEERAVPGGTALFRVYFLGGSHPANWRGFRHYGPVNGRFDHHLPPPRLQERGIMYLARHPRTCLAEVVQAKRRIDVATAQPTLVGFRLTRDLRMLDLTGLWPTRAGTSMALSSGPRPRAQRWARVLYEAFPGLDGLLYGSSMAGNAECLACFERAADAVPPHPDVHHALADPLLRDLLRRAAIALGYGM
jgi:hypothetical protein